MSNKGADGDKKTSECLDSKKVISTRELTQNEMSTKGPGGVKENSGVRDYRKPVNFDELTCEEFLVYEAEMRLEIMESQVATLQCDLEILEMKEKTKQMKKEIEFLKNETKRVKEACKVNLKKLLRKKIEEKQRLSGRLKD